MENDRATNPAQRHDPPSTGSPGATPEIWGELLPVVHREDGSGRTLVGRRHCVELPANPLAASLARGHVRRALAGGREELRECAELVVSELTTNAIKATADVLAGGAGDGRSARGVVAGGPVEAVGHVWIAVLQVGQRVAVEVWDCSPLPPMLTDPAADEVGGRGLLLVSAMVAQWGYRWHRPGKVVWALLGAAS